RGDLNKALTATGANPEVSVRHDAAAEQLTMTLVNTGKAACRLTLKPNRYSSAAARTFDLAPGARKTATWPLATSRHW
ncbi:phospholipase domain-containing protein, partial [Lysobacter sp. 2RAB21]